MHELKQWLLWIAASIGLDLLAFKSGMIGGFISLTWAQKPTPMQAVISIIVGAVSAGYLGPLVKDMVGAGDATYGGICFLIGLLAMRTMPYLLEWAEGAAKNPGSLLEKIPFRRNGNPK